MREDKGEVLTQQVWTDDEEINKRFSRDFGKGLQLGETAMMTRSRG